MESVKKIFINYRRKDYKGSVKFFLQCLRNDYGDVIFFDESSIEKGAIFPDKIKQALKACQLFLPVIGPNWEKDEYLHRLLDPEDWVRQELELAKTQIKYIIPVLIDRDGKPPAANLLPESIREGIFDRNAIELGKDDAFWPEELKRYYELIEKHTGLKPTPRVKTILDEHYKKLTYCLDRNEEIKKIKTSRNTRQVLFSGSGAENTPFDRFVERCCISDNSNFTSIFPDATPKRIGLNFFKTSPKEDYPKELYNQISRALGLPKVNSDEEMITAIKYQFKCGQRYVFWAQRSGDSAHKQSGGAIGIWWDTWHMLLDEGQNQNVLVLLFTIPKWLQRWLFFLYRKPGRPHYIGHFKDKIDKQFIDDWEDEFTVYLQIANKQTAFDHTILGNKLSEFFPSNRFSLVKTFEYNKAVDNLHKALIESYQDTNISEH